MNDMNPTIHDILHDHVSQRVTVHTANGRDYTANVVHVGGDLVELASRGHGGGGMTFHVRIEDITTVGVAL